MIMRVTLTVALIATSLEARSSRLARSSEPNQLLMDDFIGFASQFNKHYRTTEELGERLNVYQNNREKVAQLNESNRSTGVSFRMNQSGDLTDEEFRMRQGLDKEHQSERPSEQEIEEKYQLKLEQTGHSGRRMQDTGLLSKNYVELGNVTPVKDQGDCGSCWAFAATTVQESLQSIWLDTAPERLSEQECIDCAANAYGCNGGWMLSCWEFSEENGLQFEADYPYEAVDGGCRNQEYRRIASMVSSSGNLSANSGSISYDLVNYGPVSLAVAAGNDCWRWYEGGILSSANECPTVPDHGVVLVGIDRSTDTPFWIVQNSWGTEWGLNGFIHLAIEEGDGVSGMNTMAQWVLVKAGYPEEPVVFCPNLDVDESQNEMGWGRCASDSDCRGFRECSAYGLCMGKEYCEEPLPEPCEIEEIDNGMGHNRCGNQIDCKGDRTCSIWGYCEGIHNCTTEEI